jgi:hypothetical protein
VIPRRLRDDADRMNAIRLLHLCGQRDQLQHQRDLLRRDLAYELQQRCRNGQRTPEAIALEERIRANLAEWQVIITEIRELQSVRTAA